jgi:hypothetical protein
MVRNLSRECSLSLKAGFENETPRDDETGFSGSHASHDAGRGDGKSGT